MASSNDEIKSEELSHQFSKLLNDDKGKIQARNGKV